jgi:hypothetical protein
MIKKKYKIQDSIIKKDKENKMTWQGRKIIEEKKKSPETY